MLEISIANGPFTEYTANRMFTSPINRILSLPGDRL